MSRRGVVFAWSLVAVTTLSIVVAAFMPDEDWPLFAIVGLGIVMLGFAALGMVILIRARGNAVGWGFLLGALLVATGLLATQYANRALIDAPGTLPGGDIAAWFQSWLWAPFGAILASVLYVFPTGRPLSDRWRVLVRLTIGIGFLAIASVAFRPAPFDTFRAVDNPLGLRALASVRPVLDGIVFYGTFATSLLAVVSVVVRFRRSRSAERQQMKVFAYAVVAAVLLAALNPLYFVFLLGDRNPPLWEVSLFGFLLPLFGLCLLPAAIGLSILRYRLYDIDRLISRTATYAVVTAILAGVYALVAVLLPSVFLRGADAPAALVAAGTLAAAGAFGPVRRRVQSRVDHRFNRARFDAVRTMEAFSSRLREQVDIDALVVDLRSVVSSTMQPTAVSLWIKPSARTSR